MKVKFIKSHSKFAYFAGNIADITDEKQLEMLNGFVVPVKETVTNTDEKELEELVVPVKETATKKVTKKVETATKK